jgi:adenylate kinase family enzyme
MGNPRLVIFGNSGSGKSTLARRLSGAAGVPHLDLDTCAWEPGMPPRRRPLSESAREIAAFMDASAGWVIEGCYSSLLASPLSRSTLAIFLNPGVEACLANAGARPWEPHKYPSKEAQDANLAMLRAWIREYDARQDELSLAAHRALFDGFAGEKIELSSREAIAGFALERS